MTPPLIYTATNGALTLRGVAVSLVHLDAASHLGDQLLLQLLRVCQRRLAVRRLTVQMRDDLQTSATLIKAQHAAAVQLTSLTGANCAATSSPPSAMGGMVCVANGKAVRGC